MAFPGMEESLGGEIELPSKIEIEMDTTDFEIDTIASFVTPHIIESKEDLEKLDKLEEVYSKINQLQDASTQLVEGTGSLQDGMETLNTGIGMLSNELSVAIGKYETVKKQTADREALKEQIANILKQEMNQMLPNIQEQAQIEARNSIKRHETEIEQSVVETSMEYTKKAINEKLIEIQKNNGKILTSEQEKQLENAIAKDIREVYKKAMQDPQINAYLTELVNAIKAENKKMEQGLKAEAKEKVSNEIKAKKAETSKMTPTELAKKYANEIAKIQAIGPKNADGTPAITTMQALQMIGVVSESTLTEVETTINNKIDTITVSNTTEIEAKIRAYLDTYIKDISEQIANKFTGGNKELLEKYEANMMKQIVDSLKNQLANDQVLKAYENKLTEEVKKTISTVSQKTAQDLAQNYTQTIANEIADNVIAKQLSGEAVGGMIDQELTKYENVINEELAKVDTKIEKLKQALPQLTSGAKQLQTGSQELANGMNLFNEEGIKPIYNLVNGKLKNMGERVKKLGELSLEYNNYTMLEEGQEGKVQFILLADGIKKESKQKQEGKEAILKDENVGKEEEN